MWYGPHTSTQLWDVKSARFVAGKRERKKEVLREHHDTRRLGASVLTDLLCVCVREGKNEREKDQLWQEHAVLSDHLFVPLARASSSLSIAFLLVDNSLPSSHRPTF